ncbi:CYTH and CHAD domain-containing protein [Nitratireductor alexandrii]|uniref:CYTH and CHAD domain-containing protein n=1 Tax=Nitratireductor alexandrii TaxID=2448161 RepID=UPI0013DFEE58|nr:CYTH and CHAD domain-containing protein [Nitratireductor alexandrii]
MPASAETLDDPGAEAGARAAPTEIELKLVVPAARLAEIACAPVIERHARNAGTVRRLNSVYYDTPDRSLWEAGFTLRVRSKGSACTMTVKSTAPVNGGLLGRSEWEAPVPDMQPRIEVLAPHLPKAFFAALGAAPLEPMFSTEVRRRTRKLDLPDAVIELAVDEGRVVAGAASEPICELEFELESGAASALYDLALGLLDHGPAELSVRSKAARGFDLALGRPPAYAKAKKSALRGRVVLDDVFAAMLVDALLHFVHNKPAAVDGRHPEGVHQLRVALRRMRAILKLLGKLTDSSEAGAFADEARWLASAHGDAREWDVFLAETVPPVASGCPEIAGFAVLQAAAERLRAEGYDKARTALADRRAQRFQLLLARWIECRGWRAELSDKARAALAAPATDHALAVLTRQHRKVLAKGRHFDRLEPEARHELRLAVKKLRYVTDFLLPLCARGKRAKRYAKTLSALQDGLGRYNDVAVTAALLDRLAVPETPAAGHEACGAIRGWQARDLADLEAGLRALWDAFRAAGRPWTG